MTTTRVRSPRGEAPKPPGTASLWPAVLVSVERITTAVHGQHRFTIHVLETLQMDPALSSGVRVSRPWPRRGDTVKPDAGWRRTEARWTDIGPGGSRKLHIAPIKTKSRLGLRRVVKHVDCRFLDLISPCRPQPALESGERHPSAPSTLTPRARCSRSSRVA